MSEKQQEILSLYFNRGSYVRWFTFDREGGGVHYGIVECERSDKPGTYYVRDEKNVLHSVLWTAMKLAHRT